MNARDRAFVSGIVQDNRLLRKHGFDEWPDLDELVRYACSLEDALQAIARYLGVYLERDVRGEWQIIPRRDGEGL